MPFYRTCPECGAHLDPGERCTCKKAPRLLQQPEAHTKKPDESIPPMTDSCKPYMPVTCEVYRRSILQLINDITDVDALRAIYTIVEGYGWKENA